MGGFKPQLFYLLLTNVSQENLLFCPLSLFEGDIHRCRPLVNVHETVSEILPNVLMVRSSRLSYELPVSLFFSSRRFREVTRVRYSKSVHGCQGATSGRRSHRHQGPGQCHHNQTISEAPRSKRQKLAFKQVK